jgi:hypothetical protein
MVSGFRPTGWSLTRSAETIAHGEPSASNSIVSIFSPPLRLGYLRRGVYPIDLSRGRERAGFAWMATILAGELRF